MTRIKKGLYSLPMKFRLTVEQDARCREVFGAGYAYGMSTQPERGTDGHIYMTQQLCVRFAKDQDAVVFKMIVAA